ncbi:MAG TPA: hypothetical protein VF644_19475 [Pyrinomonadaceae bacterium]|jgi:hypothetical protein
MRFQHRKFDQSERKSPTKFELASTTEIDKFESLATDFFEKILNMNRDDCLITDESSLWDFHGEISNDLFYSKILEVYRVNVSNVERGNLVKIFQKIAQAKR